MSKPETGFKMRLFYSYSHQDEGLRKELETRLKQEEIIEGWHDGDINPGVDWDKELREKLEEADLILLLISPHYLASDFCIGEGESALKKHETGEALVIPIILRRIDDWNSSQFSVLQALPRGLNPVTDWSNRDEAWNNVVMGIRSAIKERNRHHQVRLLELAKPEKFDKSEVTLEDYFQCAEKLKDLVEMKDNFDPDILIAINQGGMVITAMMNKHWRKPVGIMHTVPVGKGRGVKFSSLPSLVESISESSETTLKFQPLRPKKILVIDPKLKTGDSAESIKEVLYQTYCTETEIVIRFAIALGYGGWQSSRWEVVYHPTHYWPVRFKPKNLDVYVAYYTDCAPTPDNIREIVRPGWRKSS